MKGKKDFLASDTAALSGGRSIHTDLCYKTMRAMHPPISAVLPIYEQSLWWSVQAISFKVERQF